MGNTFSGETLLDSNSSYQWNTLDNVPISISNESQSFPHGERCNFEGIREDFHISPDPDCHVPRTKSKTAKSLLQGLGRAVLLSEFPLNFKHNRASLPQFPAPRFVQPCHSVVVNDETKGPTSPFTISLSTAYHLKQTTEFCFMYRLYLHWQLLVDFCKYHTITDIAVEERFCQDVKISSEKHVELSERVSAVHSPHEPLIPISLDDFHEPPMNPSTELSTHSCQPRHSCTRQISSISDACHPKGALCYYSLNMTYDLWITQLGENSEWIHINESDCFCTWSLACGKLVSESSLQECFLKMIRAFSSGVSEIEVLVRCSYLSTEVLTKECIDALAGSQAVSQSNELDASFIKLRRLWDSHFSSQTYNESVRESTSSMRFRLSSSDEEGFAECERALDTLYSAIPPTLHFIDGAVLGSFVRLRLKLFGEATKQRQENQSMSGFQDLHEAIPLEWTILEVHALDNGFMLQQLLTKYHMKFTDGLILAQKVEEGDELFLRRATGGKVLDLHLAHALQEWFKSLIPPVSSRNETLQPESCLLYLDHVMALFQRRQQGALFYLTKPYRALRIITFFESFDPNIQALCFEHLLHGKLESWKYAMIEWYIFTGIRFLHLYGFHSLCHILNINNNPFTLLCNGMILLLVLHEPITKNPLNSNILDVYSKCLASNHSDSNSSMVLLSFHTIFLSFIDACFCVFLDHNEFPASLAYNRSFPQASTMPWTPIALILHLYRFITSHTANDMVQSAIWTCELKVAVTHFVATLVSLLEKEECERRLTLWDLYCHPLLHKIYQTTCSALPCSFSDLHQLSCSSWEHCFTLTVELPLWNPRRARTLIDYFRFKNEWIHDASPLLQTSLFRKLAEEVLNNPAEIQHHERYFSQLSVQSYTEASKYSGKIVLLVELRLNIPFFSRLLRHPNARRELVRELCSSQASHEVYNGPKGCCSIQESLEHSPSQFSNAVSSTRNTSLLQDLFSHNILNSFFPFRSNICETRIEFMNFVEITESGIENQSASETASDISASPYQDAEAMFLSPAHEVLILDVIEWFKRFCWVIRFPGLQWHTGCKWISEDTIVTALVQSAENLSNTQISQILKDEIYHSASVLGLRSFSITASVPYFLVENNVVSVSKNGFSSSSKDHKSFESLYQAVSLYSSVGCFLNVLHSIKNHQ